jgi:uncharacterized paraquat-inducible protein A
MTGHVASSANGKCPACEMPIPFTRAAFKRGKSFGCATCKRPLRTGKTNVGLALAAFALASFLGKQFGLLAVLCVLAFLGIYEWLTVRVTLDDARSEPTGHLG